MRNIKHLGREPNILIFFVVTVALLYVMRSSPSISAGGLNSASTRHAAPDFTVADLQGNSWSLAAHRGQVVLLNFWATWCPPCREETPGLVRLDRAYGQKGMAILGISMDEGSPQAVRDFVSFFKIPYPVALPGENFALASAIEGLPTTFLIDKKGRIAKTYAGGASERTFRTDVEALLRENGEWDCSRPPR